MGGRVRRDYLGTGLITALLLGSMSSGTYVLARCLGEPHHEPTDTSLRRGTCVQCCGLQGAAWEEGGLFWALSLWTGCVETMADWLVGSRGQTSFHSISLYTCSPFSSPVS